MRKVTLVFCLFAVLFLSFSSVEAGRYYEPEIARWTTPDPALRKMSPNELAEFDNGKLLSNSPYVYGYNNPLKYVDPDGETPWLVGAVVGGGLDFAIQVGTNLAQGQSFGNAVSNVDYKSVAVSAAAGAVGAGLATKVSKLGKLAQFGAETVIDATSSAAGQLAENGSVNLTNVGIDVVAGRTVGKLAGEATSAALSKTNTGKQLTKQADRATRVAKNRKGNRVGRQHTRNQQAADAQNKATGYIVGRGAAAGGAASQAASKAAQAGLKKNEEER
jgi:RHS repeat-associated protein